MQGLIDYGKMNLLFLPIRIIHLLIASRLKVGFPMNAASAVAIVTRIYDTHGIWRAKRIFSPSASTVRMINIVQKSGCRTDIYIHVGCKLEFQDDLDNEMNRT